MVIGYTPAVVAVVLDSVRVLLPPAVTDAGLKDAVTPAGRPEADSAADSAVPETRAVETVAVAAEPAVTEPEVGEAAIEKSFVVEPEPATTSTFAAFQPDTLTTGVAPCKSAELYDAVSVSDSPGHRVTSLSFQIAEVTSLSPDSSAPAEVPRRRSARSRNPTVGVLEVLVTVTVTCLSAPFGPALLLVLAVAEIDE